MSKINAIAVIGAGFGDEGKGLMTDYHAAKSSKNTIVVRYNGSAQAGHTVQLENGTRHIFSHFGSGTFCGLPTVLSEFFVIHPFLFKKELEELQSKGYYPEVLIHSNSMVTTPFDMLVNQIVELGRGHKRHGSVGVGFGETFDRNDYMPIYVSDLKHEDILREKLILIRDRWVPTRILERNQANDHLYNVLMEPSLIDEFLYNCKYMLQRTHIFKWDEVTNRDIIFEGAQGLMLDQTYGFFPHVTRSNTGLKNIVELLKNFDVDTLTINHVSRMYTTRHGAGPLPFESNFPEHIMDNTNHPHIFQGNLRYAPLNLTQLGNAIEWDYSAVDGGVDYEINPQLTFTCVDQLNDTMTVINNERLVDVDLNTLTNIWGATSLSYGPTRNDVKQIR